MSISEWKIQNSLCTIKTGDGHGIHGKSPKTKNVKWYLSLHQFPDKIDKITRDVFRSNQCDCKLKKKC
jgi:hypothetical protein